MKRSVVCFLAAIFLLALAGCAQTEEPSPEQPTPASAALAPSDLEGILAALDPSGATLYFYGDTEDSCPADGAIRAEKYVKELQSYTWESYQPPEEWDGSGEYRRVFVGSGVTLSVYPDGYQDARPLHVESDSGEGWFVLPYIEGEETGAAKQVSWMAYDTLERWYAEAETAARFRGSGTPLTADELDRFEDDTASEVSYYDEESGCQTAKTTPISCFFTSWYSDPRDMDAEAFLTYCPGKGVLSANDADDEAEFRLVQEKLDERMGEDNHLATIDELPVPCRRLPRTYINEILAQYAGITLKELHTDWTKEAFYIPKTDCFYTFTSDFGPGVFTPCYGEKAGDTVTLWSAPGEQRKDYAVLTLQKSGEEWHILSHQTAE